MHETSKVMTINIYPEKDIWVAYCSSPELVSQGSTIVEAMKNFTDAFQLLMEDNNGI